MQTLYIYVYILKSFFIVSFLLVQTFFSRDVKVLAGLPILSDSFLLLANVRCDCETQIAKHLNFFN